LQGRSRWIVFRDRDLDVVLLLELLDQLGARVVAPVENVELSFRRRETRRAEHRRRCQADQAYRFHVVPQKEARWVKSGLLPPIKPELPSCSQLRDRRAIQDADASS
jgi:hypothetical protein